MKRKIFIRLILCVAVLILFGSVAPTFAFKLPDTGQTKCYQGVSPYAEIPCEGTGQDGAYNINPMSFTDNGNGTVTDNNTGLIWQKYENASKYNWYQASGTYDATYNLTTQSVCGSLNLGGTSDWRLPTKKELMSIVDYSVSYPGPKIKTAYFPNAFADDYWSATTFADSDYFVWCVDLRSGFNNGGGHEAPFYVRCVRGGQYPQTSFIDNGNVTVTDNTTGLMWQQGEPGSMAWDSALGYCEGLTLGDYSDWRLPNINELNSLTDDTKLYLYPVFNTTFFPNVYGAYATGYWSATTFSDYPENAMILESWSGFTEWNSKDSASYRYVPYVRCVRGGQSGNLANLTISKSDPAAGMVSSQDGFISCGAVCSHDYEIGSQVTLTAQPGYMTTFAGWSGGGCSGTGPCTTTISENTTVTAQFITLDIPADKITMLVLNESYDPQDRRTPLILVHGHGMTEDWNDDNVLDDYEAIEADKQAGWEAFLNYYDGSPLKDNYKIYRFHYLSDIYSVSEIGKGMRKRLDEAINKGDMNDTQIVIVAHSMGGLVARSYMEESGGGSRVKKLITLATPHHGTPGANDMGLDQLSKNADTRDKSWSKIWGSRINNNNWTYTVKSASWIYWLESWNSMLSYNEPNRQDLLWDNFDGVMKVAKDKDINKWLRDKLNADTSFDDRVIAYYGYLDSNSAAYKDIVGDIYSYLPPNGPAVILTRAGEAKVSGDQHRQLLCASVLLNYGLYKNGSPYASNDGMVPLQSARFNNHTVAKRVGCPDHDHLDMLGVNIDKKCSGGKSLLETLAADLNEIIAP